MFHRGLHRWIRISKFSLAAARSPGHTRSLSTKPSEPLRVLFCGSDEFSIASLRALYEEHVAHPGFVESIDVVCRPGKPTGTGLKTIREVPISYVAQELSLPLYQVDTFTGWKPLPTANGEAINLIIAVSFGRLVPPRLLQLVKYGGLNVHPSLLPDFRGAAPVHHTLLEGCKRTGVTLQTLHPSRMDHGQILAQTPSPGFEIPSPDQISIPELTAILADQGASMLVDALSKGLFVEPVRDLTPSVERAGSELRHAPKITPQDRRVDWHAWTAEKILRRQRLIGPLWNYLDASDGRRRIIWSSGFEISGSRLHREPGMACISGTDRMLYVDSVDGTTLRAKSMKVDGFPEKPPGVLASKTDMADVSVISATDLGVFSPLRGLLI